MNAGVLCSKEMVDLLMKIKRHMKAKYDVSISMSDDDLMSKLLKLATLEDALLQSMVQYFMALAGDDWSSRYERASGQGSKSSSVQAFASRVKESIRNYDAKPVAASGSDVPGQRVRYYRGQPVYG